MPDTIVYLCIFVFYGATEICVPHLFGPVWASILKYVVEYILISILIQTCTRMVKRDMKT